MNTTANTSTLINPNTLTSSDTITIDSTSGAILTTTNGSTYTISNNYGYVNTYQPSYSFVEEGDRLVIRDQKGRECLAIKDGILMIGEKTIHQVILDVVDMVNGDKPITDLLVDPDQGKRELGKEIYERRSRKTKSKRAQPSSDKE